MDGHQLIASLKGAKRSRDELCMKKDADIHTELPKVLQLTLTTTAVCSRNAEWQGSLRGNMHVSKVPGLVLGKCRRGDHRSIVS